MRVGMVCPYSLSVPGGVQAQVMGLARELRRSGIEVRVLAPCDGPPPATFVTPLGDSLPTSANGSIAPLAPDPSCQLRMIRALTEEEFDVLHLHEPFIPGPTQTATLLHTAPIIATFHSAGDSAAYRYLRRPVLAASHRLAHRVAVSKDAEELVKRYIGGEYEILFNGVELEQYREARPHPSEGPTIFFLGRHEERKGLDVLLAAMRQLPDDVRLWVAGTGPDTARLQAQYADDRRIEWLGRVSDADKVARLTGATVFCAPSLHGESFGVVLIEAMAAGTAIVASGLDGYRNVATDGVDAVLVEPGDVQALVDGLKRVLYDAELRDRLIAAGGPRAEQFSMRRLAALYAAHYRRIAADRAERRRMLDEARERRRVSRMLARAIGRR
ncbi:MAG: glycosyltransferase family 4 protein [Acidimicrobiales bacterium]|nr:glycosyltransferase family 4 protein [Acidimicrobiales bacterium]MCB9394487.1 glycosyltransferase family 4 protein [Acidimicrobiaceae bacterium]